MFQHDTMRITRHKLCGLAALSLLLLVVSQVGVAGEVQGKSKKAECSGLSVVVNGQTIYQMAMPIIRTDSSGKKQELISVEMAMTPIEFITSAGFKMRVPASVLSASIDECDDSGRYKRMNFRYLREDKTLVAYAQSKDAGKFHNNKVIVLAEFFPFTDKKLPASFPVSKASDILRDAGPPQSLPQFGLTAYSRLGARNFSEYWDMFVLNKTHSGVGDEIVILCSVSKSKLLDDELINDKYDYFNACRGKLIIRNGFGVLVDIPGSQLKNANNIYKQVIQTLSSYIVKE